MSPDLSISVVTSCYNGEKYIEDTIRSVINQQYQNLQYILIDGASTDNTMAIVEKYKNDIDIIISEPDNGQYHGIMKGLQLANGDIMAWLNADDFYYPWTFSLVNRIFQKFPDVHWIIGLPTYSNNFSDCIKVCSTTPSYPRRYIKKGFFKYPLAGYLQQESMFWRKSLWEEAGGLNLNLPYVADYELWTRFAKITELVALTVPLASFRQRPGEQRSNINSYYENEADQVAKEIARPPYIWNYLARKGIIWRFICRLMIWEKSRFIGYSPNKKDWIIKNTYRPISKASIQELINEYLLK